MHFHQKVNTVRPRVVNIARPYTTPVNTIRVKGVNAIKSLAYWVWRPTKANGASLTFKRHNYIDARGRSKSVMAWVPKESNFLILYVQGKPQHDDKGFVDSGCSRHMTGNIAYLLDFKEFDGGYVAFRKVFSQLVFRGGAYGGRITGKGTLKTGNLDFEDDETSEILNNFIKEIETLVDLKVKIIKSDNGTEFKNKVMDDFCREKGTSEENSQDCIVMPIWKDTLYFDSPIKDVDNGEPKTVDDAQKQIKDGPNNENTEQERFSNESILKKFNASWVKHLNTASTEVFNTISTTPNTRIHKDHPIDNVIGEVKSTVHTRRMKKPTSEQGFLSDVKNFCNLNFNRFGYLRICLVERGPLEQNGSSEIKKDERGIVIRNKARLVAHDHRQEKGIDYEENAFLYGTIKKEVYVTQPPGFKDPDHLDKVYKVQGTFKVCASAPRRGLQVQQKQDGIFISQDKYAAEILKKFNYSDVKSASTPVDLKKPLVKDGDADDVDVHIYRSMIVSLMYLTASRPDIMFAVCACARFQVTPKTSHLLAVKRIFRYLKGKPTLGLWYSRDSPFELVAYTDSDYAGATQDRKSTTGGCQFLGNMLISWQCKKQTVVANSTTEAEYVATGSCCGQVGDEAVHKELGDRMERAATTASSLEAEQDSGSGPRCQDTILGDVNAQTSIQFLLLVYFTAAKLMLGSVNAVRHMLMLPVQVPAAEGVYKYFD
ncbi:putative ribonuclease H-like domain-containing protein [Tanacetum coccineum]|uniref:Ribonuclease H-like domain-containing protein n=1 Tax=Tanacetum coccineum TaxID=301880 RepID=A0ABQ5CWL3_9ASTR